MDHSTVRAAALIIFILIAGIPFATAGTGGYSVEPAIALAASGQPQDPVAVSFEELTIRGMIIAVALSICPLLVYPVEALLLTKIILILGYRRVEQYALSYNRNRQKIYEAVQANPGVRFTALERMTGIAEGTLKYHLLVLATKRRIICFGSGRSVRYFENNGHFNDLEKKVLLYLQDPTSRRILEILISSPEVSRKEIAATVGITGPSITWHTKRLAGDGIITTRKEGRAVRYTLCPSGARIFRQFFWNYAETGVEQGILGEGY